MVAAGDPSTTVRLFAHRGFAGVVPENTLAAARRAGGLGADTIEFDVVATADGTPVVFHDRRLDADGASRGITDASGAVAGRSTETVTDTSVLGTSYHIPTLSAFVEAVPDTVSLNVELKRPGTGGTTEVGPDGGFTREQWVPFVERVLDAVDREPNSVLYSSFSQSALEVVRAISPNARIAPIAYTLETATTIADALDAEAVHPAIDGLPAESVRLDDYAVNAWTARTWTDVDDALRFGVDGVIADYPNLLSTLRKWHSDGSE
ncbi:glycerophosphodiester phosphodiesterase [Halopenitus persicus]|uniref:glycerophosphodiester phosphodiesterase n=1 Tax=Halopenitus persicus TaxID=1048396 RepID=UPI000BBB66A4|nr:glycerophosphodiester phosphodiesterase [Halopenitus persicus]